MKFRWIALGISLFLWAATVAELLIRYIEVDTIIGRPVLYFVILAAGILIGKGLQQRSD